MYLQRSPYVPIVTHELDTQNFEHFDEDARGISGSGAKRWARADPNFIGYTYKSYEAVQPADGTNLLCPVRQQCALKDLGARLDPDKCESDIAVRRDILRC